MNASGRDDTALANAVLNGVAMSVSAAASWAGVRPERLEPAVYQEFLSLSKLAIVGDDSLYFLPGTLRSGEAWTDPSSGIKATLQRFGFIAKVGHSTNIKDAVFLGCRPMQHRGQWHWVPTLGRRLYKHHACIHPAASPIPWLRGVAEGEREYLGAVPVLGAMARRTCELLGPGKVTRLAFHEGYFDWSHRPLGGEPSEEAYESVAAVYSHLGVTVALLKDLEAEVQKTSSLPVVLQHPALRAMLMTDDA